MSKNAVSAFSFRPLTGKDTIRLFQRVCKNPKELHLYTEIGIDKGKVVANDDCKNKKGQFGFLHSEGKIKCYEARHPPPRVKKPTITYEKYGEIRQELQTLEELKLKEYDKTVEMCITEKCINLKKEIDTFEKKLAKQSSTKRKATDTFDSTLTGLSSPKKSKTAKPASTSEMKDCDQTSTMPPMNATMDTTGDIEEIVRMKDKVGDLSSSEDDSE